MIDFFRKTNNIWFFGAFIFVLYSSTRTIKPTGVIDHFKVGDVVHSMLNPEQFSKIHGNNWVLMDGRPLSETSDDLRKYYGFSSVPDARGIFVRAMNSKNPTVGNDPDRDRVVGSVQDQMLLSHSHTWIGFIEKFSGGGNTGEGGDGGNYPKVQRTTEPFGGVENRPRNVSLYLYIKINEEPR